MAWSLNIFGNKFYLTKLKLIFSLLIVLTIGQNILKAKDHDKAPALAAPTNTVVNVSTAAELWTAVQNVASNSTIMIAPGTYNLTNTCNFSNTVTNVTIRGSTNNRDDVILLGQGMGVTSASVPHGIYVGNATNLTVANLTIGEVQDHCITVDGATSGLHIYNVRMFDAGEQFVKGSAGSGGHDSGIVEYCLIEYTVADANLSTYTNGVDVHDGASWIIRHNKFVKMQGPSSGSLSGPAILMWNSSSNTLVEGNTFINCEREICLGLVDKSGANDHTGGIVRNNFIYRDGTHRGDIGIGVYDCPDAVIYNNTVMIGGTYSNAIEYRFSATNNVIVTNNICSANITARSGAAGTVSSNITNAASTLFENYSSGDLHLKSSASSAIDQGATIASVTEDYDGQARPSGSSYDIGADEYQSSASSYNITTTAGTGGSVSPSSPVSVTAGQDQAFAITADVGYQIDDVVIDGSSVGTVTSYTFSNVSTTHTVAVTYKNADTTISTESWDWVSEMKTITASYSGATGKVVIMGDSNTYANQSSRWARFGTGKTTEETEISTWMHASNNDSTNGWWLAADDQPTNRSWTAASGVTSGEYIAGGKGDLPSLANIISSHNPQIAVILLGTNDLNASVTSTAFLSNMQSIYTACLNNGTIPVVCTLTPTNWGSADDYRAYNTGLINLAQTMKLPLLDVNNEFLSRRPGNTWLNTLINNDGAHMITTNSSGPATVDNLKSGGSLLRCYLQTHKIREIRNKVIDYKTVTITVGANGSASPSGTQTVDYHGDSSLTFTASSGYEIDDVLVDGSSVGAVNSHTISDITSNRTVSVSFKSLSFQISSGAGTGGSISPSGSVAVNIGSSTAFNISANGGYAIDDVLVNGSSVGAVTTYTFTNVTSDQTIQANFSLISVTHTITAISDSNGSMSPLGSVTVGDGNDQVFSFTPNSGYEIDYVELDGSNLGALTSYTISNVTSAHTLKVFYIFSAVVHSITASSGSNGGISPDGNVAVVDSNNQSFTISPDSGYEINDVLVNGSSVGTSSTYSFMNVTTDQTISATFKAINTFYTITVTSDSNGNVVPEGAVIVNGNTTKSFDIVPNKGYQVESIKLDNVTMLLADPFMLNNINADHTLEVTFSLIPVKHTIVATVGVGGEISPAGSASVVDGFDQAYTITPEGGYLITDVLVDNISVGAVSSYTFINTTQDHTISATFVLSDVIHTVEVSSGSNGSISPTGSVLIADSTSKSFMIEADSSYEIDDVVVDGVSQGKLSTYTFYNVTKGHTISASFVASSVNHTITASVVGNGSISPFGNVLVSDAGSRTFAFIPDSGYEVSDVSVNGISKGVITGYTYVNILSDQALEVSFSQIVDSSNSFLLTFSFDQFFPAIDGVIEDNKVTVELPAGSSLDSLVASFSYSGSSIKVNDASQISGLTKNNFKNNIEYILTAEDGSTKSYQIIITHKEDSTSNATGDSSTSGSDDSGTSTGSSSDNGSSGTTESDNSSGSSASTSSSGGGGCQYADSSSDFSFLFLFILSFVLTIFRTKPKC
ncbi:MAG: hypothetical protein COA79_08755 [Planctomycetota bacterium]|nr:MAG: hypothetical protein COA79_08755 [Planctomycetota bacterium]